MLTNPLQAVFLSWYLQGVNRAAFQGSWFQGAGGGRKPGLARATVQPGESGLIPAFTDGPWAGAQQGDFPEVTQLAGPELSN